MLNTWNKFELSDLIDIKHGYAFSSVYFSGKKTNKILLTPGNFHVDGYLYFGENTKYYHAETDEEYHLSNGDLLIVMTDLTKEMNILGNAVILQSAKTVLHNQRIGKVLIKDDSIIDKKFLCYLLNSNQCKKPIKRTATGSTVRHTSNKSIYSIKVSIPPLEEQKKIAKILSTWDNVITLTEKLLKKYKKQKHGLIQKLLTGE